jgi:hypothetical protein
VAAGDTLRVVDDGGETGSVAAQLQHHRVEIGDRRRRQLPGDDPPAQRLNLHRNQDQLTAAIIDGGHRSHQKAMAP